MKRKSVRTKHDFVRRYEAGEFGNRSPTWTRLVDYTASGYRGPIHIRNRIPGGPTWYNVPYGEVIIRYQELARTPGIDPRNLYLSAMAPHDRGTIQGEVWEEPGRGLLLTYNTQRLPMREGFAVERREAYGLRALGLLRHYLNQRSYDWLMYLLDAYDGHVVEFSAFEVCWGTEPGFNTCFWEVRGEY